MFYSHFGGQETPCPSAAWKSIVLFTKSDCWILKTSHQRTAKSLSWEATNHSFFYTFRISVTVFPWFSLWTPLREMNSLHTFIPYSYICLISSSISTWVSQIVSFLQDFQTTDSRKKSQSGTNRLSVVNCYLFCLSNCNHVPKKLLDEKFHGRRPVGRPRMRWEDITRDFSLQANVRGWWKLQQERGISGTPEEASTRCGLSRR